MQDMLSGMAEKFENGLALPYIYIYLYIYIYINFFLYIYRDITYMTTLDILKPQYLTAEPRIGIEQ